MGLSALFVSRLQLLLLLLQRHQRLHRSLRLERSFNLAMLLCERLGSTSKQAQSLSGSPIKSLEIIPGGHVWRSLTRPTNTSQVGFAY